MDGTDFSALQIEEGDCWTNENCEKSSTLKILWWNQTTYLVSSNLVNYGICNYTSFKNNGNDDDVLTSPLGGLGTSIGSYLQKSSIRSPAWKDAFKPVPVKSHFQ